MIVALEGTNGVGKTTTAKALVETLRFLGHNAEYLRLPGNGQVGEKIRDILNDKEIKGQYTKLLLYLADMHEAFQNLDPDTIWVMDRSFISTIVYQSTVEGIDAEFINELCHTLKVPRHYVFLLKCDPDVAVARLAERDTKTLGTYADQNPEFYGRLQDAYLKAVEFDQVVGSNYHIIDTTTKNTQEVLQSVVVSMKELLRYDKNNT